MSKALKDIKHQAELNEKAPNFIGYYKQLVLELLSEDAHSLFPFSELESTPLEVGCEGQDKPLFRGGMVHEVSDFRRERLKGILGQSVADLKRETDEMLDSILAKFQIETELRRRGKSPCIPGTLHENSIKCLCSEKQKPSACPVHIQLEVDTSDLKSQRYKKVYENFNQGMKEDGLHPKQALEKCSSDIFTQLELLEENLEEYLDTALLQCRPMTIAEKQQLGQRIHKLPRKALDRVVEIIRNRNHSKQNPSNNIIKINLEEEDDITLWRIYSYVEVVMLANKSSNSASVGCIA